MTVKQQQCLLTYLGYDPGMIDGADGPRTQAALAAFRADYGAGAALLDAVAGRIPPAKQGTASFWAEIRYFRREEFRCPCGCGGFPAEPREKLVRMAEAVRAHFGAPATVSSGVRCAAHNRAVGGVSNSRHLTGSAVDLSIRGRSAQEVLQYVRTQPECAYAYAITADGRETGYVHMDVV